MKPPQKIAEIEEWIRREKHRDWVPWLKPIIAREQSALAKLKRPSPRA
jgi:hypothetical protein